MNSGSSKKDQSFFGFNTGNEWDYENGFYLTSHVTRLAKIVAHFELYKSITELPGDVVECGIYKGASLIRFATFREILESPYSRKIIGFDAFGKFPQQRDQVDAHYAENFEQTGGEGIPVDELQRVLDHKSLGNIELIPGNMLDTIPEYNANHSELKISLLHVDVDVYSTSLVVLNHFYDKVVQGGLIVLDDFGTVAGETRAIDDFFSGKGVQIKKLSFTHIPAYIRK